MKKTLRQNATPREQGTRPVLLAMLVLFALAIAFSISTQTPTGMFTAAPVVEETPTAEIPVEPTPSESPADTVDAPVETVPDPAPVEKTPPASVAPSFGTTGMTTEGFSIATATQITSDAHDHLLHHWTPDGSTFVYEQNDGTGFYQIYKVSASGGTETALTSDSFDHTASEVSPDGTTVAYLKTDGTGFKQVYSVPLAGGSETNLTSDSHDHTFFQWSPNGTKIAFIQKDAGTYGQIWTMKSDGTSAVQLTADGSALHEYPSWSPDSGTIAYVNLNITSFTWELGVIPSSGGDAVELTASAASDVIPRTFPVWGANSTTVYFTRYVTASPYYHLHSITTAGTELTDLTPAATTEYGDIDLNNANTTFVFKFKDENMSQYNIATMPLATKVITNYSSAGTHSTDDPSRPLWNNDGTKIGWLQQEFPASHVQIFSDTFGSVSGPSCTTISTSGLYAFNVSVSTTLPSCINVSTNDVTVDCQGHTITGNRGADQHGINASSRNNVTIKNCFLTNLSDGIFFTRVRNGTIFNNTIINNSNDGIRMINTNLTVISHNNLSDNANDNLEFSGLFINVTNNTIVNARGGSTAHGVGVNRITSDVRFINNTIMRSQDKGLRIVETPNLVIMNNTFISNGDDSITVYNSTKANITFNKIINTGGNGILLTNTNFSLVWQNNISESGITAVYLINSSANNITNNTLGLAHIELIRLGNNSQNNTFINNTLRTNVTWVRAVDALSTLNNNNFTNTVYENVNGSVRVPGSTYINSTTLVNATNFWITPNKAFLNVSSNLSWLNVSAFITLRNISNTTPTAAVDYGDTGTFVTCPADLCTNASYDGSTFIFNVSHWTSYRAQEATIDCGSLTSNTVLTQSVSATGTCFTVTANNLVLDCAGFTITYDSAGSGDNYGVLAVGQSNVTVRNCVIQDATAGGANSVGVNMTLTNNSRVTNTTVLMNGTTGVYGVIMRGAGENVSVVNNTFFGELGSSSTAVYISTLISLANVSFNVISLNNTVSPTGIKSDGTSENGTIQNNTMTLYGMPSVGLSLSSSSRNLISFNNIRANVVRKSGITSDIQYPAVTVSGDSLYNLIHNNSLWANESSAYAYGVVISGPAKYNNVTGNFIDPIGTGTGVYLYYTNNNTVNNNSLNATNTGISVYTNPFLGEGNVSGNIVDANRISSVTAISLSGAANTTVTNNLILNSTSGIGLGTGSGQNWVRNNTLINVTVGLGITGASSNNTFVENQIISAYYALSVTDANNSNFTNTRVANATHWVTVGAQSFVNLTNTTFVTNNGSARFSERIALNASNVSLANLNVLLNRTFVNATNISAFNRSAFITLNGLAFDDATPVVDYADTGTFSACPTDTCTEVSYAGGTFVFNVSHWTSFAAQETSAGANTTNVTLTKADLSDPVIAGSSLQYNITINNTGTDTAYNVTLTDTYDTNVTFSSASPIPVGANNETFIIGNLTAGQVYVVNITVTVKSTTFNATIINNTANISWVNTTGVFNTKNTTINTTARGDIQTSGCQNVSLAGTYRLSQNLTFRGENASCLTLNTSDVTVDCNGFSMTGNRTEGQQGFNASGINNVTIKNCLLTNFTDGVVFARIRNATIFNNTVINNSDDGLDIRTTNFSVISYNNATRNFDTNILISASWFLNISNNSASDAAGDIFSNGFVVGALSNNIQIINNTAVNNQNNGFLIAQSYNNSLISNTVYDNGDDGIRINLSLKTLVQSNLARNNSDDGISVEISNFTVLDLNNASNNFDNNIVITDGNFNNITNNTLSNARGDTFSNGITLSNNSNNNLIRNNTAVNNQDDGVQLFESNYTIVDNNVINGNGDDGVDLSNSTGMNVTRNRISNNHFGIALTPGLGSSFTNNTIFNNTGDGIFAARHSRDNVILANTILDHTSALGNGINVYTNNSYQSNITIERNIIDRTGSYAITILNLSFNITIFNNTITNPGMNTSAADGIYAREVKGLNITRNSVTGSNDSSIAVDLSENVTIALNTLAQANRSYIFVNESNVTLISNNTITSSTVVDLKLLNATNVTLLDSPIGNFSITLSGITVRDTSEGEIAFNNRSMTASGANFSGNVRIKPNNVTVNLSTLNASANLTLYGLTFTNAVAIVDTTDTGGFVNCTASLCTNTSYDGSTFRFNVSHWTTFGAEEAVVGGASTINASLMSVQSLNFSALPDGNFNSSNIYNINYLLLNLSINASAGISDWYLNFTADGTSGCALGNVQNNICYHYDNASYQWIQFRNTTNTSTFDNRKLADNDGIVAVGTSSATNLNLSLRIGEHYAPNVFKHYNASYNFSNFTWETGASQVIHQSNLIRIHLTETNSPIVMDADHYRFDITINVSSLTPQSPLAIFLCNSSYTSGDPHNAASCQLVGTRTAAEVRQNTHFREVFTSSLINRLGDLRYAVLHSNANNAARYYTLKTYKALNPTHTTHWEYSTTMGTSWTNLADGYETDASLQWYYDGPDPSTFKYALWTNDTTGASTVYLGNVTWNITPTQNWRPIAYLEDPSESATLSLPTRINFTLVDPNTDQLNGTITLWSGGSLVSTLVTGLNQSNTSTNWSGTPDGTYNLTLNACELGTTELYCMNETHEVTITTPDTSANSTCGVITQSTTLNASVNATGNCFSIIASNVTLNCNGHTIYWMGDGAAVNASHQTNVTVQNCFILDNSTLFGDGATTNTVGINFTNITIGLIRNNTILTNDTSNGMGIAITGVTNGAGGFIVITNNTINATGSSLSHYGIQFVGSMSNSNNVTQNVIRTGGTTSNIGVYMTAGPTNIGIYNNIIFVSGTSSVAGMNAVRSSNVKFNNITIAGTSNPAGIILNSGQGSNVSFNNITIIGTTSRFAGIAARGTTQNNLNISDNRIVVQTTSPSTSILEHAGIALEIFATNHSINNNNVTINNGYVFLVNDSVNFTATNNKVSAGSGVYVSNTEAMNATFVNLTIESSNGSINFPNSINITGAQNFSINSYNVSNNSIFLNSTNLSFFNVSANLVLNNLGFTNAVSIIDFTDTNTFTNCTASVCTNTSYAGGVFRFNVSHFTTFKAEEFVIQTPVYNFTNLSVVKSDVLDPVNVSGQLNYTILITVTNGTAYNITVNESFPSGVVFSTSSPAALADNRSFRIGNLTVGTVYRVNITVNVSNGFANNTLINNTANVTFQNETGGFITYSANQSTTILVPPGDVNATNFTLTKTDAPDPVTVSTYLNYTINVTNIGNTTLINVTLSDAYSASVRFNNSSPSPVGGTNDTFILSNLTPGQRYQVNITVLVLNLSNATQFNNTANVSFVNATGAFFTQNTTITTTAVNLLAYNTTNITVVKSDVSDPTNISALLNYTINITSTGTGMAYNVTLNETYANETIFVSASPTPTGAANDTFLIGNISAGSVYVVNISVLTRNISNGTVINNTANVSFANETGARFNFSDAEQTTVQNITIEPAPEEETPPSGGGGGGGGGGALPVVAPVKPCAESWICDEWTACEGGVHDRTCYDLSSCGTEKAKPVTTESCAEAKSVIELPKIFVAIGKLFTSSDWSNPQIIILLSSGALSLLLALWIEYQLRKRYVHAHAVYAIEAGILFGLGLYAWHQPGNVSQAVMLLLIAAAVSFAALFFIEIIRHGKTAVMARWGRTSLPLPPQKPTITRGVTSLLQLRSKQTHEQVDDARMHVNRINLELKEIKKQLKKK